MKLSSSHQVNKRTNESLKQKQEKNKNNKMKNSGMHSRMMKDEKLEKDEGRMVNNESKERTDEWTSMAYVDNKVEQT